MPKFMVIQSMAHEAMSREQVTRLEEAIQDSSEVGGYRSFYSLAEGRAVSILEAPDKEVLADWFERNEVPYESISALELEGHHKVIFPEAEDTYWECEWCEASIYRGNASVTILRHIEQVDWNEKIENDEVTVIDSSHLLTLCGRCGNRLDQEALTEALRD